MELKAKNIEIGFVKGNAIFSPVSFSATEGDMIALLGVNGIGKSTLLRTIACLQPKINGQLLMDGRELTEISAPERAQLISIVLTERISIDNITVRDFIALGRSPYTNWLGKLSETDEEIINEVIHLMKIEKLQAKLFNHTSDGEKQKALIARAICQQTPVVILDEPTAFLDFRNKREIMQLLSNICVQLKKIVILSTHDIEASLEYCSKCWIMGEEKEFLEIRKTENFNQDVRARLKMGPV